ncbi:MAG: two-component regulator propeller domain-containing protein [Bacteroidota bacterium]
MKLQIFIWLSLFAFNTLAQEPVWFDEVTNEKGISWHGVHHFLQDKSGYMWMCHEDALSKFDGYSFKNYSRKELSDSRFESRTANLVFKDSRDQLWIVTDGGALMQYDPELDRFKTVNDTSRMIQGIAYAFVEDDQHNFWIGAMQGGLYKINLAKLTYEQFTFSKTDTTTISSNYVSGLVVDKSGQLWVGTTGGLCLYDKKKNSFQRIKLANNNPTDIFRYRVIRNLMLSGDEQLYVGTYGGLHRFNIKTKTDQHFIHNDEDPYSISHNSVFKMVEDTTGKIWIATYGGGVNRYDPRTGKFAYWKSKPTDSRSLHTNNVFTLYFDNRGVLWIGGADQGVFVHDPHAKKIYRAEHDPANPESLSPGWIRSIYQENDSMVWIGFNGTGLNYFNLRTGKVVARYMNDPKDDSSLGHNTVLAIEKDAAGDLWLGLEGGGLNKLERRTGKFKRYTYTPGRNSISNNAVSAIRLDDELIWVASYVSGLDVYNTISNTFFHFSEDSLKSQGISFSTVETIIKHDQNIWFATANGIVIFDKTRKIFVKVPDSKGELKTSSTGTALTIELRPYIDRELLLKKQRTQIHRILYNSPVDIRQQVLWKDTANMMVNEEAPFVADRFGNLWLAEERTLFKVDLHKKLIQPLTPSDGILAKKGLSDIFLGNDGRIFVTSAQGFNWFQPREIKNDTVGVPVVFTDFEVFNRPVSIGEADTAGDDVLFLPKHISRLERLDLDHHHNFFSFHFAALVFHQRDKIQYAYKMEGFDKDWVFTGNRRFASYTNLDPGEYVFKVKAASADGFWNETPASIVIVIHPPLWKTWWFMTLVVVVISSLVYVAHLYRVQQSLKLERLRTKIASDLHDEVGSSLTRISLYSELLQNDTEEKERRNYLKGISNLSREIVSTMSDIVWSIDNRYDTFGSLVLRMKDFATEVLQPKNIEMNFITNGIDEAKMLDPVLKQNLYLIFKESINNIVRHAQATEVKIRLANEGHQFKMIIRDNGKGFPPDESSRGNGLVNMRRRAKAIQASFNVTNHQGITINIIRAAI